MEEWRRHTSPETDHRPTRSDLDVLSFYLSGLPVRRVSSFGSLAHFNQKNKPAAAGAATRCLQCPAQDECVWSARKIYLDAFDPATASGRRLNVRAHPSLPPSSYPFIDKPPAVV